MGCTHYWEREQYLSEVLFQTVIGELQKIFADIDAALAGREGEGTPYLSLDEIVFNGVRGQHCEDFKIRRVGFPREGGTKIYSFCKTEKMPYDLCVKITLIILKHYFEESLQVTSDAKDGDWQDARDRSQRCLGYGNEFLLDSK